MHWDMMNGKQKITVIAVSLLVIALLFWFPVTRQIILFVLPLGSGIDDLVFIVCLTFGGILLLIRMIAGKKMD